MKLKFTKFSCGLAAAALAFALVACDDSSSGPSDEELFVQENPELSSDSGIPPSSAQPLSSGTELSSNSGSGPVNNCTDNEQGLATNCVEPQSSASVEESSSSVAESSSGVQAETCRHITDEQDPAKKWLCEEAEYTIAQDCAKELIYMCIENRWIPVNDCNPDKAMCGFDNYKMCIETGIKQFCLDTAWVDEPCDPEVHGYTRFLYKYTNPEDPRDDSFSESRYFCENGKWTEEKLVHGACDAGMDCSDNKTDDTGILPDNAPCEKDGAKMIVEGYTFQCINNVWTRL